MCPSCSWHALYTMIFKPHYVIYDEYANFISTEPRLLHKYTYKPLFSFHIVGLPVPPPPSKISIWIVMGRASGPVEMVWGELATLVHLGHVTTSTLAVLVHLGLVMGRPLALLR